MGEWLEPDGFGVLLAVAEQFGVAEADRNRFVGALLDTGLVVRERYYVPDARELVNLMRPLSYHLRTTQGYRWAMCRETFDALVRKYTNYRVPAPMTFDSSFWRSEAADAMPTAALEMEVLQVIEDRRYWGDHSMLFGMPIRIDPAARSPLFEVDSENTRS